MTQKDLYPRPSRLHLWLGPALLVVALLGAIFLVFHQWTPAQNAATETQQATRFITVAGTGKLEMEDGKFFVRGAWQPEVALGAIDKNTFIVTDRTERGIGRMDIIQNHYLGRHVTVIALVEAKVDNETVFRPVHTDHLTIFRHSDGLPGRNAR